MSKRYGEAHHRFGKTQSEETRAKMRAAWVARKARMAEAGLDTASPISDLSSDEISARWKAWKEGVGPYPFARREDQE